MKMTDIKFNKGDWVVHAQHGIGRVEDLSIKKIADQNVVCLEIKTKALTYFLPINDANAHHIRHISTPRRIKEALQIIASTPNPISTDYRIRNKHISDEIAKGSLASRACLIRDLNSRSIIRSNEVNENAALNRLKLQLVDEMMLVFDISRQDAQKKLDRALQKSGKTRSD